MVVDTGRRVFSGLEGSTVSYPFTSVPPEPRLPGEDASIPAHSEVTGRNERRSQGAAWYMARNSRVSNHDHDCGGTVRASLNSKACVREILPKADARNTHSAAMSILHSLMTTAGCRIVARSAVRMLWNSSRGRGHLDIDRSPEPVQRECTVNVRGVCESRKPCQYSTASTSSDADAPASTTLFGLHYKCTWMR